MSPHMLWRWSWQKEKGSGRLRKQSRQQGWRSRGGKKQSKHGEKLCRQNKGRPRLASEGDAVHRPRQEEAQLLLCGVEEEQHRRHQVECPAQVEAEQ